MGAGLLHWLLAVLGSLTLAAVAAAQGASQPVTVLPAQAAAAATHVWGWVGSAEEAPFEKATSGQLDFRPHAQTSFQPLGPGRVLWLRVRLAAAPGSFEPWLLVFPLPILDSVTVYQPTADGWVVDRAGDTVPGSGWTQPGRYPFFRLHVPPGQTTEVYVQVRHATPVYLPLRIQPASVHFLRSELEFLGLGIALGALALLVAGSVLRAWKLRDSAYGWYAAYAMLSTLALAAFTGVAGHLLWGDTPGWADAAPGCLALLAAALAILVVGQLSGALTRTRRLGRATRWLGWSGFACAIFYLLAERRMGIALLALYLLAVAVLSLWVAALTWRRGDPVGRWMMLGSLPLAVAVLVAVARVLSWIDASLLTEYALVLALTVELPMLLAAINSRSRERRGAELRQEAAASQDPLTGLLKGAPFRARLEQALARFRRRGEGAAVAMIEVANYDWIKNSRGAEAAEEALLRAVIKLRRLVRDVDTTGRLGEARFGLILEGVSTRAVVSSFASRLVAAGLMEEPGRADDVALRLHISATLLPEYAPTSDELLQALSAVLGSMSARTHRPFRFVDPNDPLVHPQPSDGGTTSGLADVVPAPQGP